MNSIYCDTTVSPELVHRLRTMPKVELHVHLEGAMEAATVWELARRNHVILPAQTLEDWQSMYSFRDFDHFIEIYFLVAGCIQSPDDFVLMTERFLERQAQHNIKYCEAFISASLLQEKFPQGEVINALAEGIRQGEAAHGVQLRFIPDITRELPATRHRVFDFALYGKEQCVFIGLGLGDTENGYPAELFSDVFAEARRQGLHVVAHAGETAGPESIWGAIHSLHAERIGHGVRAIEDQRLVEHLHQTQLPLEVSPYSNYRLKVVRLHEPHPIRALVNQGVYVTVNSDDPLMFSTDLTNEYVLLARQGFSWDELWQLNLNALEASFLSEEAKAIYREEWQSYRALLSKG